jgi:hypothetical protein
MALEKSLWQRLITAQKQLIGAGHLIHLCRLENSAGSGNPDVDGCLDSHQLWIELKSCTRPVRAKTPIRPKWRPSQKEWFERRVRAGCKINWILLQVGDAQKAKLYLLPGAEYGLIGPEAEFELLSVCDPFATPATVLLRAVQGW